MTACPGFEHLVVRERHGVLFVLLNAPATRNALAPGLVAELSRVLDQAEAADTLRAVVLRGAGGFFCAGGNVGNFSERLAATSEDGADPIAAQNRKFGSFMTRLAALPVPLVSCVEGGAFGGGLGLVCASDMVIATRDAKFSLSEMTLGLIPAQIMPFVAARIGARLTRRIGLGGERLDGAAALAVGLADEIVADGAALDAALARWLGGLLRCAPGANRAFKTALAENGHLLLSDQLDDAARRFSACMRGEGREGIAAFREKRKAEWVQAITGADVAESFGGAA